MNGQVSENRHSVTLNHDADLYALPQRREVENPADCLFERALGLDDVVVQASFGSVNRNTNHDVVQANSRISPREVRVSEAPSVREQVQ